MSKQVNVLKHGQRKVVRKINTQVKYRYLNNLKKYLYSRTLEDTLSIKKRAAFTFCGSGKLHVTGCNGPF